MLLIVIVVNVTGLLEMVIEEDGTMTLATIKLPVLVNVGVVVISVLGKIMLDRSCGMFCCC